MKYLITRTDIYRCDTEEEAKSFLQELKDGGLCVISSTIQMKEKKQKGEVVDEWTRLTVKTVYNDEKEPDFPFEVENYQGCDRGDNEEYGQF